MSGRLFFPRGTNELPDLCVGNPAFRGRGRTLRDNASGRRRTSIVVHPVDEVAAAKIVADVVGSDDGSPTAFAHGHARAIHASAITGPCQLVNPSAQINVIHGRQAATFFDIQKNYGVRRKAFFLCGGGGLARVSGSLFLGLRLELIGAIDARLRPNALEFADLRTVVKHDKTETLRTEKLALPCPGVCLFTRRRAQPKTHERKGLAKDWESGIARVSVAVEPEIGFLEGRGLWVRPMMFCDRGQSKTACQHAKPKECEQTFHDLRVTLRGVCGRPDCRGRRRRRICKFR